MNGKVEFSKKEIDFYDKLRYGDLLTGISKQIEIKTFVGIPKCNVFFFKYLLSSTSPVGT